MQRRFIFPLVACVFVLSSARLSADTATLTKFDSNGVKIRYTVEGKGEPVVLIHGFTASGDLNWRLPGVISALAEKYQVIAIDNRGHGLSEKPHDASKYGEEMAEDTIRLLDHLNIKKAHIVGYSMGGMIAAKLLTTHPDRMLSVTLGGHGGLKEGDDTTAIEALAQSLDSGKGIKPLLVFLNPKGKPLPSDADIEAINKRILALNDPKALAAVCRSFKGLMITLAKLKDNKVPALALIGELDPLKKGVDALEGNVPNLKIVVIKDADHMNAFSKEQFVSELKSFLAAHGADASAANGANGVTGKFRKNIPAVPSRN
jgi:pimeloyl-ACP methyl ester carboxylesterase